MSEIITAIVILFSLASVIIMLKARTSERLQRPKSLAAVGIIAFIADGIGVGSFAVSIALCKSFQLISNDKLPGLINGAQVVPGAIEAIAFLFAIHVDPLTLTTLIAGTCLGGVIGPLLVSKLDTKRTELSMATAFVIMAILVLCSQMHWLPMGGTATILTQQQLIVGFIGTIICGALPAFGVGLFAAIEVLLFMLGLSPLAAFPIMTCAGAIQQPLTAITFTIKKRIPIKEALWLGTFGIIGVAIAVPMVTHLSIRLLRWLLFAILCYNATGMIRAYLKHSN